MNKTQAISLVVFMLALLCWFGQTIILAQRSSDTGVAAEVDRRVQIQQEREQARRTREEVELATRLTKIEVKLEGLEKLAGHVTTASYSAIVLLLGAIGRFVWGRLHKTVGLVDKADD